MQNPVALRQSFSLDWKFILPASLRLALQSVLLYSKPLRSNSTSYEQW
jgi:hypothetical protein